MKKIVLCLVISSFLTQWCFAGIFMEIWESLGNQTPEITYHFYENNKWKIEDTSGLYTIIDFDKNTFMVVYPKEKVYAIENLNEVLKEMQRASEKMMTEDKNKQASNAQFEKKYAGKETVNTIPCTHYQVLESGKLIEELWLSTKPSLQPLEKLFARLKDISKPSPAVREAFSDDENIDKLIAGLGFPIKVKSYTPEGIIISEVKYMTEKPGDDDMFSTPVAYDMIPLVEVYIRAYSDK